MEEISIKITLTHDRDGMIFTHREMKLGGTTTGDLAMLLLELENAKQDIMRIHSRTGPLYSVHKKERR
ncbi:unnamed protein product [marine sediment metagenome]|uniref:Uncharacterized protein n=1 Tax=marine sediment metagenome TaxID=412755 RepID=X1H5E9_9ZZZZ